VTTPTIHLERLEFNTNTFFEFDTTVVTPRLWVNKKHLKNNIKYHTYIFNLTCPLNMNTASELYLTMYIYKQNSANPYNSYIVESGVKHPNPNPSEFNLPKMYRQAFHISS
jgi:hypothetical protein